MSTVYFSSPARTASLAGGEKHRLWHMAHDITTGLLAVRKPWGQERMEELTGTAPPEGFSFQSWAIQMEDRLVNSAAAGITWRGVELNKHAFVANTAMAIGADPVKLAVRMYEQCDDHCWVEGPDRAWLAGIIGQGLESGVFAARFLNHGDGPLFLPTGWEDVRALLLAGDDEPVVLSYSGSGQFPGEPPAGWRPELDGDDDLLYDQWNHLGAAGRWRIGMDGLRAWRPWQRLAPDAWDGYRFVHGLSVLDLLADDYAERLDKALASTERTDDQ